MWVQSLGWVDPWRRKWLPTPVFLLGKFHEQRTLGYRQQGGKELDMTEYTCTHVREWIPLVFLHSLPLQGKYASHLFVAKIWG